MTRLQVTLFCLVSLAVFLVAVWQLAPICRWLWPIPVVGFVVYPYLKRVTWLAHLWLGAVDGLAPMGAWIAIRGDLRGRRGRSGRRRRLVAGFDLFSRCSTWTSTGPRASTRGRPGGASAACSSARVLSIC